MDVKLFLARAVYLVIMIGLVNKPVITFTESINAFIRTFDKEFKLYYEDKGILKQIVMSIPPVLYFIGIINFKDNITLTLLSIVFIMALEVINNNKFIGYEDVLLDGISSAVKIDYDFQKLNDGNFYITGILVFVAVCGKRRYTNCFADNIEPLRDIFHRIN